MVISNYNPHCFDMDMVDLFQKDFPCDGKMTPESYYSHAHAKRLFQPQILEPKPFLQTTSLASHQESKALRKVVMTEPHRLMDSPKLERQKQQYQTPSLEQHQYLSLTGVNLSIGGNVIPNPLELQELQ